MTLLERMSQIICK